MNMTHFMQARNSFAQLEATLPSLSSDEVIRRIEAFLRDFPEYAPAHSALAQLLLKQGDRMQALARFERAVRLDPANHGFRKDLASFYYSELGWTDDAISMYTSLLKEDPQDLKVLEALAHISQETGQNEQAMVFLREICERDPANSDAQCRMEELTTRPECEKQNISPASPSPEPVEEVETLLHDLRESLSDCAPLTEQPEPQASPATFTHSALAPPDSWLSGCIAELEEQLRSDPTNSLLHNDLGVLYMEKGNLDLALSHHELACRYAPQRVHFYTSTFSKDR